MGDEWETPNELFNGVNNYIGGFDLDVCANDNNHKHDKYYTIEDNSLNQEWFGKCWCNPPYSKQRPWIEKTINSIKQGNVSVVCMLIPMSPETKYFQELILKNGLYVQNIFMIEGRIKFLQDKKEVGSPKFGSCLVEFKNNPSGKINFYTCDRQFGNIKCVGQ